MHIRLGCRVLGLSLVLSGMAASTRVCADVGPTPGTAGEPGTPNSAKVCRLGAINVPHDLFRWYVDHGYDLIGRVQGGPPGSEPEVLEVLAKHGVEYFNYGGGTIEIDDMGLENVPAERRGLKRGPGSNKYNNPECVCAGWDDAYELCGRRTAAKIGSRPEAGIIFEDYLNRALCYCPACEADYRSQTGRPGFPAVVYDTPHYEDTTAFDPVLLSWDQQRLARHLRLMAEPIHQTGKKVMVAGVCRWIVGAEAAEAVDGVMFYTYYAGRRLPPNFMRNWKYWKDHIIPRDLWVVFGYFREYHTCHTRVLLAHLPDGVNLAFWACGRQMSDASTRDDALYAHDVVTSHLLPIRVAVYDSQYTEAYRRGRRAAGRESRVDRSVIGLERLGLDARIVRSLDGLEDFELLYLEDVECLGREERERIRNSGIPVLATGITGLRDEAGKLWKEVEPSLSSGDKAARILNLLSPVTLSPDRINIEVEGLKLTHPWFEFMFDTVSPKRGIAGTSRPYTDPALYHGVRQHVVSLLPSRVYGEFLADAFISRFHGVPLAISSETQVPMVVYDPEVRQVYSTVRFSDYVHPDDLTECGHGYQMRLFCFLQIIDALTLARRGVRVEPYMTTAVRATPGGHFLTIGNVHDEPRPVTVTLDRVPREVRLNHARYDGFEGRVVSLPLIPPKDAVQLHIDY